MHPEIFPDTTSDAPTALALVRDLVDLGYRVEFQPQDDNHRYGVVLCGYDCEPVDASDEPSPEAALLAAYKQAQR